MVRTTTREQSVYPDIALISVTIVFIELKTHKNINFSRNQETLTETTILRINKTLHTDK
jgi:hypothetical protein